MKQQFICQGDLRIVYDSEVAPHLTPEWFDRDALLTEGASDEVCGGRGRPLFFQRDGGEFVLKHYRRGGLVGRVIRDTYCYAGEAAVRSFREWQLLARLQALGLPVPTPCAARYRRRGLLFYSADLITRRLPARPVSQWLGEAHLSAEHWRAIGVMLSRFHRAGVYHADLNAHNVLLSESGGEVFLLDFDQARIFAAADSARCKANLKRLKRSLLKLKAHSRTFFCEPDRDFCALMQGYEVG